MVNKFLRHLGSKIRFICCSWKHETTETEKIELCEIVHKWIFYSTGWGLSPDFLLVTLLVLQFTIKLVIIMNAP